MTSVKTADEIVEALEALPQLPKVYAESMIYAQAFAPSKEERAIIDTHLDTLHSLGLSLRVSLPVFDRGEHLIGHLHY